MSSRTSSANGSSNGFKIQRRDTVVVPTVVVATNSVSKALNYILIAYSTVIVIMHFANMEAPEWLDIYVSVFSLLLPIVVYGCKLLAAHFKPTNATAPMPPNARKAIFAIPKTNTLKAINLNDLDIQLDESLGVSPGDSL